VTRAPAGRAVRQARAAPPEAVGAEQPPGTQFVEQTVAIVLHFDGQSWSRVDLGGSFPGLLAVSGSSPDDLWAGGRSATLLHRH
jgi:hypothetical protein